MRMTTKKKGGSLLLPLVLLVLVAAALTAWTAVTRNRKTLERSLTSLSSTDSTTTHEELFRGAALEESNRRLKSKQGKRTGKKDTYGDGSSDDSSDAFDESKTDGENDIREDPQEPPRPDYVPESIESDIIDDLDLCLTFDESLLEDYNGKAISTIPVPADYYRAGIFVQPQRVVDPATYKRDCTSENCFPMQNITREGALYCELCSFTYKKQRKSKKVPAELAVLQSELRQCDDEVAKIARSCRKKRCVKNAPPLKDFVERWNHKSDHSENRQEDSQVDRSDEKDEGPSNRELLLYDLAQWNFPKNRWMGELQDRKLFSKSYKIRMGDILFPGSHDSGAVDFFEDSCSGLPSRAPSDLRRRFAKTQEYRIYDQMNAGMRFLDIRVKDGSYKTVDYPVHHGYYVKDQGFPLALADVFYDVNLFLASNPTETVVVEVRTDPCPKLKSSSMATIRNMLSSYSNLRELKQDDLNDYILNLKGLGLIDLQESLVDERFPGAGNMRPHQWANYHIASRGASNKFNLWGFFPGVDWDAIKDELAWCITIVGCFVKDGLEDWDKRFESHMWQMHSVIGQSSSGISSSTPVNALFGNRVNKGSLYDVALRITMYRLFKKRGLPYDAVIPIDYVHDWDKKFEYHCPRGSILQGFQSYHSDWKEDRRWKAQCRFVDWIQGYQYRSDSTTSWPYCGYYGCHHPMMASGGAHLELKNSWDGRLYFYMSGGSYALTGFGGVHDDHREDRRWWFYVTRVTKTSITCSWTNYVNSWDMAMDWYTSSSQWIAGVDSYHSDKKEDRRWKFWVCSGT